jgi:alkylhydroperoxidase/carboxymuconolactone decarboxylase family protein YurZ
MPLDELLAREGLAPPLRLMVLTITAVWRADWDTLQACARASAARSLPRQDLEETLLQSVLFCGFPRAVTAFEQLGEAWPAATAPAGGGLPPAEQGRAGQALFARIYGPNAASVRARLKTFHEDFHDFVLEAAYGRILTRAHLGPRVREVLAVAVLAAQDQLRQFVAHARGALHFGSNPAELRETLVSVFGETAQVDLWLARLDRNFRRPEDLS